MGCIHSSQIKIKTLRNKDIQSQKDITEEKKWIDDNIDLIIKIIQTKINQDVWKKVEMGESNLYIMMDQSFGRYSETRSICSAEPNGTKRYLNTPIPPAYNIKLMKEIKRRKVLEVSNGCKLTFFEKYEDPNFKSTLYGIDLLISW